MAVSEGLTLPQWQPLGLGLQSNWGANMIKLLLGGMSCDCCVNKITRLVLSIDETAQVSANIASGELDIVSDLSADCFAEAIMDLGYKVTRRL
jgi:copper chaperone CopZ